MINHIKDLWNGKIKLYIVFWIYYIVIGTLIDMFTIEKYNSIIDISSFLAFTVLYIYCLFINKALWSSANIYKGKLIWKLLVKIIVILDLFWLLVLFPLRLFAPKSFEQLLILLGV